MLRLLGFLIGSAVALSLILIVTGRIEPSVLDDTADKVQRIAMNAVQATEEIIAKPVPEPLPEQEPKPLSEPLPEPKPEPQPEPEPVALEPATVEPASVDAFESGVQTVDRGYDDSLFDHRVSPLVKDPETEMPLDEQMQAEGLLWHVFWDPFRSEIAATGFIDQLESITGLNYGVIRRKIGVYEVAFAYATEEERDAGLLAIEQATGISFAGWQQ